MARRFTVETVFTAVDQVTGPVRRIEGALTGFVGATARVSAGAATAATGFGLLVDQFTRADAQSQLLSKSVIANVDEMEALAGAVSGAGFDMESVNALVEEFNNKIGESTALEEITPVHEAFTAMGSSLEEIEKLEPWEAFQKTTDALLQMGDAREAAAAADILLGGEANRIMGVLRQQGSTIEEVTKPFKELSIRTEESRKGSMALQDVLGRIGFLFNNVATEVSGLVGAALAPYLEELVAKFKALDKEVLKAKIGDFVDGLVNGVKWLIENRQGILQWMKTIATVVTVLLTLSTVLGSVASALTIFNLLIAMNPISLIVIGVTALIAGLVALAMNFEAVIGWIENTDGVLGAFLIPIKAVIQLFRTLKELWQFFTGERDAKDVKMFQGAKSAFKDIMKWIDKAIKGYEKLIDLRNEFIGKVVDKALDLIGLGRDDDDSDAAPIVTDSPNDRLAATLEEKRLIQTAEVKILDKTGQAELDNGTLGTGISMLNTGAF